MPNTKIVATPIVFGAFVRFSLVLSSNAWQFYFLLNP